MNTIYADMAIEIFRQLQKEKEGKIIGSSQKQSTATNAGDIHEIGS
jgi:hypothetical protein